MTAYALFFKPARLIVASDTLGYIPSRTEVRPLGFLSKVFPLAHLKAVIFSRGQMQIPAHAAMCLGLDPAVHTIEAAAEALPEILTKVTEQYCAEQDIDDPDSLAIAEVVLAGWSEAERRCRVWYFFNGTGYEPQDDGGENYGLLALPGLPEMPQATGSLDKQLIAIMHAEQRYFDDNPDLMHGMRLGGEIQSWTIDREGISQRVIYRYPDYAETLHAGAAVAARIARGDEHVSVADGLTPTAEAKTADDVERDSARAADVAVSGGNRAERRRAEKAARKAGRRAA